MSLNWEEKKMEDLLEEKFGKHDYDWLLSPPETRSSTRSVSTTRASRLSAPHTEKSTSTRPVRSRSVIATRSSISNSYLISSSSYDNKTSVTSQPARSSSTPARSFTPVRTRPPSPSGGVKTAGPRRNSRPSSPTNLNTNATTLASRSNSRSSTPTHRPLAPTIVRSRSVGQIPKPKVGISSDLPDLRKLSQRPGSVGRTGQRAAMTAPTDSQLDTTSSSCLSRRHSLPL